MKRLAGEGTLESSNDVDELMNLAADGFAITIPPASI